MGRIKDKRMESAREYYEQFPDGTDIEEMRVEQCDKRTEHDLYTDADADRPDVICDSNGSVTLSLCKRCGLGESQLLDNPKCSGFKVWTQAKRVQS